MLNKLTDWWQFNDLLYFCCWRDDWLQWSQPSDTGVQQSFAERVVRKLYRAHGVIDRKQKSRVLEYCSAECLCWFLVHKPERTARGQWLPDRAKCHAFTRFVYTQERAPLPCVSLTQFMGTDVEVWEAAIEVLPSNVNEVPMEVSDKMSRWKQLVALAHVPHHHLRTDAILRFQPIAREERLRLLREVESSAKYNQRWLVDEDTLDVALEMLARLPRLELPTLDTDIYGACGTNRNPISVCVSHLSHELEELLQKCVADEGRDWTTELQRMNNKVIIMRKKMCGPTDGDVSVANARSRLEEMERKLEDSKLWKRADEATFASDPVLKRMKV